jgi:hypothetical protein
VAKYTSIQDKDLGLGDIRKNIAALSGMAVKAGIVEGSGEQDGVDIAQYAAWNEYGVKGPPVSENGDGIWFIPPRKFIRGWTDDKAENIKTIQEKIVKKVSEGKWDADDAIKRLGEFAQDGIKSFIRTGGFKPNAERTIKLKTVRGKKGTTPLIDTGTMRNSIRYEVVKK